jgi:RNA polymerase sigma-70 factor, ECF subfamily
MTQATDEDLIKKYLSGDEPAFRELTERYLKPIYNFVYRYTRSGSSAEDITQDVFVNVWKSIKKFDQDKKFKTWVFTIAKNTSLNWVKKKKPLLFSELSNLKMEDGGRDDSFVDSILDPAPLPDEIFAKADLKNKLDLAMLSLDQNYQAVLFLHYNDHFTFQEISEMLGKSINTIKSQHRRGIVLLKKVLTA